MHWRKSFLQQARFYGIVDLGYCQSENVTTVTRHMLAGGVEIIQLRAKKESLTQVRELAQKIRQAIPAKKALFILNDYPALAPEVEADGVHIGQDDGSVADARAFLESDQIIGKSTHSLEQALATAAEKPDYLAVGPLFATPTKPDYLPVGLELIQRVRARVNLPLFCIGGINEATLPQVLAAGAERIVIVSDLLKSADIAAYGNRIQSKLKKKEEMVAAL